MSSAPALIFWNLGNSANQSDPGTGVPWNSVAAVSNSSGTSRSGSAIYLGDGYLLTANHVTISSTYSYVTFNGSDFYEIDTSFKAGSRYAGKQVLSGNGSVVLDLAVFKLKTVPTGVTPVLMLTTPSEQIAPATIIGWGVGRADSSSLGNATVAWGNATTSAKRWGLNEPKTFMPISYSGYSFNSIVTVAGASGPGYFPAGLGNAEAALTLLDSGAALFQQISGTWYLIGVANTVEQQAGTNTSTFGIDSLTDSMSGDPKRGDQNFFTRISSYHTQIQALIPEPSTGGMIAMSLLFAWIFHSRKKRDNSQT